MVSGKNVAVVQLLRFYLRVEDTDFISMYPNSGDGTNSF